MKAFVLCLLLGYGIGAASAAADPAQDLARANLAYQRGDVVDAVAQLRKAAEQDYAPAQVRLAYILDQSEQNDEALRWYRRAAELGDPEGQYSLGQMYLTGEAGGEDLEQAWHWITEAAENGFTPAMHTLILNYERGGRGLPADPQQALNWLRRAAERGDRWAAGRLQQATTKTSADDTE